LADLNIPKPKADCLFRGMFLNNPLKPIPFLSEKWEKKYRVYPVNPVKFN
jgi:hypothetical protein